MDGLELEKRLKKLNPDFTVHWESDSRFALATGKPALFFKERFICPIERKDIPLDDVYVGHQAVPVICSVFEGQTLSSAYHQDAAFIQGEPGYWRMERLLGEKMETVVPLGDGREVLLRRFRAKLKGQIVNTIILTMYFRIIEERPLIAALGLREILKRIAAAGINGCSRVELEREFGIDLHKVVKDGAIISTNVPGCIKLCSEV